MENQNPLLIQVIEEMPAEAKQLKWRKDEITGVEHVTMMGLKIEICIKQTSADGLPGYYVKTVMTNWQYLGIESEAQVKKTALLVVAKQLTQLSHHLSTLANNFEQL